MLNAIPEEEIKEEKEDEDNHIENARKKFQNKSMYELSKEMKNEWNAPSLDSYGDANVFLTYKKAKWFETVDIIQLKREQEAQNTEFLKYELEKVRRAERAAIKEKKKI